MTSFLNRKQSSRMAAPSANDPAIRELLRMHTYCRPGKGSTVKKFCADYLDGLPGMKRDAIGNRFMRIGAAPVLWSSHTDTVHTRDGMQRVAYGDGILTLAHGEAANCLGADDSAGVWIMRQMILRNVPGLYIFHAEEETGGHGSAYIAKNNPGLLHGIDYAIALDRKGIDSVVTYQFGGRCASEDFAESLSVQLGGYFAPDDSGTFTDTANYTDLIPECTNLSVGYAGAHSHAESLNVTFCAELLEKLCALDVSALPVSRNPELTDYYGEVTRGDVEVSCDSLGDLVFDHPDCAADILAEYGITPDIFRAYLRGSGLN